MKRVLHYALRLYKRVISPMLPHSCRFVPTCSEYAMEAVERHGAWRGSLLAAWRLLRCHPLARAGYDPVPRAAEGRGFSRAESALKRGAPALATVAEANLEEVRVRRAEARHFHPRAGRKVQLG